MSNNYWRRELLKLLAIVAVFCGIAQFIGDWQSALIAALLVYVGLLLTSLQQLLRWLQSGMPDEHIPRQRGVIGEIVTVVSRNKQAIEQSYQQQQVSVQQFTDIISAIPSATVILKQNHEIEWANYPALLLLGIDGKRDVGVKIDALLRQSKFNKYLTQARGEEFEMTSPVDSSITLMVQLAEYTDNKRLLLAHNISSHVDSQRSRRTFIANASHELRTPLTVISGYLEFIQGTPELPEALQIPVDRAIQQAENMRILIEDLLTLSQLENKALTADALLRIDLRKHLDHLLQTLQASGKLADHQLSINMPEDLFINASPKELDSVCYNLINNALKYSEAGTQIRITWEKTAKRQAKFSVSDQGIGIAPEHIAHLTERFYRVDNGRSRRVGGTGLGLSIAKHIVERHHGQIEIYSQLGEGSTFSAIFPLAEDEDSMTA